MKFNDNIVKDYYHKLVLPLLEYKKIKSVKETGRGKK